MVPAISINKAPAPTIMMAATLEGCSEQGSMAGGGGGERPMAGQSLGSSGPNYAPRILPTPIAEELAALRCKMKMSG
ncbi:unnamed protein product [Linum trigynum]|uniref:Uncharacterized protein n=1 Tax=Linum trigynum TaxID=586398 RepID=A0AAV2DAN5_9ROSI